MEFFRKQGAKGGKIGGKRSLETMTPEQRTERARSRYYGANATGPDAGFCASGPWLLLRPFGMGNRPQVPQGHFYAPQEVNAMANFEGDG